MATTAYAHLTSTATQIYIALYTAFLNYVYNIFQRNASAVREFNERFVAVRPQADEVLDCFAILLRHGSAYFDHVVANMVVSAALDFVTALLVSVDPFNLQCQIRYRLIFTSFLLQLSTSANHDVSFVRKKSGASAAYAVFAFPRELPPHSFIQALPDMIAYINHGKFVHISLIP